MLTKKGAHSSAFVHGIPCGSHDIPGLFYRHIPNSRVELLMSVSFFIALISVFHLVVAFVPGCRGYLNLFYIRGLNRFLITVSRTMALGAP